MQPAIDVATRFLQANPPPGRVVLCAITGSHQYGFPSVDSDIDLKGIHMAPTEAFLGLSRPSDNHDRLEVYQGIECDLTTHEAGRALSLLLKGNGNMLERITSPYQLVDGPEVATLRSLVDASLSRRCHGHYSGYLKGMRREHERQGRVKSLLYAYRVALTGIHALSTGTIEAHLPTLADHYGLDHLAPLIERKRSAEKIAMDPAESKNHIAHFEQLAGELDAARDRSPLPESPPAPDRVEAWLVDQRLRGLAR